MVKTSAPPRKINSFYTCLPDKCMLLTRCLLIFGWKKNGARNFKLFINGCYFYEMAVPTSTQTQYVVRNKILSSTEEIQQQRSLRFMFFKKPYFKKTLSVTRPHHLEETKVLQFPKPYDQNLQKQNTVYLFTYDFHGSSYRYINNFLSSNWDKKGGIFLHQCLCQKLPDLLLESEPPPAWWNEPQFRWSRSNERIGRWDIWSLSHVGTQLEFSVSFWFRADEPEGERKKPPLW